ncbi:SDR family NAD(P)-dependent oxidoreductase [Pseudofrankia inefficax]|uniref:Short-chain dehydrogenase/reductase SDR n=1 Tax=Pseudofrankia inefficax (strain DSM 45817 / CECT 9037 / DDB 130130 / EuI1c) TaxID=298654 RepID=E3IU91_PSEI1|nr:SDR family NAD(P)-dependent oxidoreductase [Pseudofrankia inefficax]ADP82428.1 short-chain dehydrogenase/reductase SDR [Pseudofrankia inefficax]
MTERGFDGRVAVVTGGGRGLGREYALLLASEGAQVVVNDLGAAIDGDGADAAPADQVVAEITARGGQAVACAASVATPAGAEEIIGTALDSFGRVDVLVHNAGNTRRVALDEISEEDFRAVVDVHLLGGFHVVRAAFPRMAAAGYGRIVLTSSIGGLYGNHNVVGYSAAKAGLIGLSNVVALEGAARGVRSNVIVPAAVTRLAVGHDTSRFPPMQPGLVAPVVGWLAHESCSVTGEIYVALAGRVARAFVAETEGVYQPSWTIDEVGARIDAIRDPSSQWALAPVPSGFVEHLDRSFAMARQGAAS